MNKSRWIALAFATLMPLAHGAVTVNIAQSGPDVVATATGTLDLSGLSGGGSGPSVAMLEYASATNYAYLVGATGVSVANYYLATFVTAQPLHGAAFSRAADSSSGGAVGVDGVGAANPVLVVPNGYVSGAAISGTATWTSTTLAGLSLSPGTYVFDYGTDNITFNVIGSSPPAVVATPVPTTNEWVLLALAGIIALAGLAAMRRPPV